jgi:hypothetical protein
MPKGRRRYILGDLALLLETADGRVADIVDALEEGGILGGLCEALSAINVAVLAHLGRASAEEGRVIGLVPHREARHFLLTTKVLGPLEDKVLQRTS